MTTFAETIARLFQRRTRREEPEPGPPRAVAAPGPPPPPSPRVLPEQVKPLPLPQQAEEDYLGFLMKKPVHKTGPNRLQGLSRRYSGGGRSDRPQG